MAGVNCFRWTDTERLSMAALGSRTEENLQAERIHWCMEMLERDFMLRGWVTDNWYSAIRSIRSEPIGIATDDFNEGDMVAIDLGKRTVSRA